VAAAERAEQAFAQRFRHGQAPDSMPEVTLHAPPGGLAVAQALKQAGLVPSVTEAVRNIEQGGVKLNGERLADKARKLVAGETVVAQVGKRKFSRIRISWATKSTLSSTVTTSAMRAPTFSAATRTTGRCRSIISSG
jgi:tyrosyl-tRNA synthetase